MLKDTIKNYFFRPGFSWTQRAVRFIPYVVPQGCIPSASRYVAYPQQKNIFSMLGITSSNIPSSFFHFYGDNFHRPKFMVETVKLMPWPLMSEPLAHRLHYKAIKEVKSRRRAYQNHEPYQQFTLPLSIWDDGAESTALEFSLSSFLGEDLELDISQAYGLDAESAGSVTRDLREALSCRSDFDEEQDQSDFVIDISIEARAESLTSYLVGCALGRWDIRYATDEFAPPDLSDPFAETPICPPGQLQSSNGLPAKQEDVPSSYPLSIPWDGILVDFLGHSLDIELRSREVISAIWSNCSNEDIEDVIENIHSSLGVASLRDWFGRPANFFASHLKRYSKSRRQAPIYWQISVGSGSYAAWLYYHRFTQDTLYRLLGDFVDPRIQQAERDQLELVSQGALSGDAATRLQETQTLLQDLRLLKSELDLVAPLWNPNLNDGVIINHAILWRITPYTPWQKKCKQCWDKLVKGDYDWAHLAFHLWPERVIPKCTTDRSLAIAHGLDDRLWQETNNDNWLPRQLSEADLQALISEHTNPAVKNALERFLAAPPPVAPAKKRAKHASTGSPRKSRSSASAPADPEIIRQVLFTLTAAPDEGLSKNDIAALQGVDASALTPVIKQLKTALQIEQLGAARGAKYKLTQAGRSAIDADTGAEA